MPEPIEDVAAAERQFRDALEDVVTIAGRLAPYCDSPADLVEMIKGALKSKGQLRLLMSVVRAEE